MSSYLPTFKWPTLAFQTRTASASADDAPLSSLPPAEREALDELAALAAPLLSSPPLPLPPTDAWASLHRPSHAELRDEVLLRLLRFNGLHAERAARQLRSIFVWRARSRVAVQPVSAMRGAAAGIPVVLLDATGSGGERLFFAAAEQYVKRDVDHKRQEVGVAKMFDYMLYDPDGPRLSRSSVVVDFTGFSVKNVDLMGLKTGVSTYMSYYPDVFHKILLINYPKFLYGVWRVICPLLDERTANRVIWLANGEALRKELEGAYTKADIPAFLGGGEDDAASIELLNGAVVDTAALTGRFS